jgi:hypothetical protein
MQLGIFVLLASAAAKGIFRSGTRHAHGSSSSNASDLSWPVNPPNHEQRKSAQAPHPPSPQGTQRNRANSGIPSPPPHPPATTQRLTPRRSGAHHAAGAGTRQQPTGIRQVRRHRRNCGICRCAPLRRAAAVIQDPKRPKKSKLCHYDGCAARDHTPRSGGPGRDGQRQNRYRNSLETPDSILTSASGSGKTLAFLIPLLESLYRSRWSSSDGLGALVISPTRELSLQIFDVLRCALPAALRVLEYHACFDGLLHCCRQVGCTHSFSAGLVIGGKDVDEEKSRICGMNILVCTPGRLLQHLDETVGFDAAALQVFVVVKSVATAT